MKITKPAGRRQSGRGKARRLAGSLAAGAVVAGVLVAWEDLHNHAALAAAAAGPQPKGVHETVGSILATGGIVTSLVVAAAGVRGRHGAGAPPQRPVCSAPVSRGGTAPPQSRVRAVVADDRHHRETGPHTGQPRRHLGRARARHGRDSPRGDERHPDPAARGGPVRARHLGAADGPCGCRRGAAAQAPPGDRPLRRAVRQARRGRDRQHARRHGRTVHAFLVAKAGPRWENREHRPLMFRKVREDGR